MLSVRVNGSDRIRLLPRWRGLRHYEPDAWAPFLDLVRPSDLLVDVGAHVGLYAVASARRGARVLAFEPDPANARALRWHVRLNHVGGRVSLIEAAVGEADGATLLAGRGLPQSGAADLYFRPGVDYRVVPVVSLDSLFLPERIRVDLMKIDVEGYEGRVLAGGAALLADPDLAPRAILLELHPAVIEQRLGEDPADVRGAVEGHGYEIRVLDGGDHERWLATRSPGRPTGL